jgi:peptidyl-tRNA hydrolase, PTH1 family
MNDLKTILIFGLGNPGEKHHNSRHNIGREIINFLVKEFNTSFEHKKKLKSFLAEVNQNSHKILLAKTEMFMNESGYAVRLIKDYYNISNQNIWIIQDDVDIAFGNIKTSFERNAAGHHGIESIIKHLGNNEFHRIRIGIWNRPFSEKKKEITQSYVMQKFIPEELDKILDIKKEVAQIIKATF